MQKIIVGVFLLSIASSAKVLAHDLDCEVNINGQSNLVLNEGDFCPDPGDCKNPLSFSVTLTIHNLDEDNVGTAIGVKDEFLVATVPAGFAAFAKLFDGEGLDIDAGADFTRTFTTNPIFSKGDCIRASRDLMALKLTSRIGVIENVFEVTSDSGTVSCRAEVLCGPEFLTVNECPAVSFGGPVLKP